ncbi:MAG: type II toxin-antitoxin system RelE/ParE family toxin [Elusimicrobia bacterium]|nr:type II toxin-antitoxin system RelE/ParE family toxin [Elusimicrobiota bacterium]
MAEYRIYETKRFTKDLEQDFSGQKTKIQHKLLTYVYPQLRQNPYYGKNIKKLVNYNPATGRYRIGDYRFFYTIDDHQKIVFVIAADNRQGTY